VEGQQDGVPRRPHPMLERFVRGFENATKSNEELARVLSRTIEAMAGPRDGLTAALDDHAKALDQQSKLMSQLTAELRGLRIDLRKMQASRGFNILDLLQ
jgi:uncharacterized membrane protein YccC